ncbi:MAG: hypothetical protein U5J78_01170 [Parasphingorhabdus sp.]|nr:hypothetical protein [Parasphingorhabdus sp.]
MIAAATPTIRSLYRHVASSHFSTRWESKKCHLGGNSMGGFIALRAAL